jgi:hypothetical protein
MCGWRAEVKKAQMAEIARHDREFVDIYETAESDKIAPSTVTRVAD